MLDSKDYDAVICSHCDYVVLLPRENKIGNRCYRCPHCGAVVRQARYVSMKFIAVAALSALILLSATVFTPFMSVSAYGIHAGMSLRDIYTALFPGWLSLLAVFTLLAVVFPLIMLLQICFYGFLPCIKPGRLAARIYAVCHHFTMIDVFVLGISVSLVKLVSLTDITFNSGFFAGMLCSALIIWCSSKMPPLRFWGKVMEQSRFDPAGDHIRLDLKAKDQGIVVCRHCGKSFRPGKTCCCPRCGAAVSARNHDCRLSCLLLLLAAGVLYLPANLYPIMFTDYLGSSLGSNILSGVVSMWEMDSYFVAIVIFIASLCIPVFKIISLGFLLWKLRKQAAYKYIKRYARLYRWVAFIGKWSMIDVFVVIIMSTIVRMGGMLTIAPGVAIICFCMVVIITIFAAEEFDERLLWDQEAP